MFDFSSVYFRWIAAGTSVTGRLMPCSFEWYWDGVLAIGRVVFFFPRSEKKNLVLRCFLWIVNWLIPDVFFRWGRKKTDHVHEECGGCIFIWCFLILVPNVYCFFFSFFLWFQDEAMFFFLFGFSVAEALVFIFWNGGSDCGRAPRRRTTSSRTTEDRHEGQASPRRHRKRLLRMR